MDGLRAEAESIFEAEQQFETANNLAQAELGFVTISQYTNTTFTPATLLPQVIVERLKRPIPQYQGETSKASLRLVKIDRKFDGTFKTGKRQFMDIFTNLGLDSHLLYMVKSSIYGFYHLKHDIPGSIGHVVHTCYVNTVSFMLLWSYNTQTKQTQAMMIPRATDGRDHYSIFRSFQATLERHKVLVDDPWFCLFVCGIELTHWINTSTEEQLVQIRAVEAVTGHGPGVDEDKAVHPDTDTLARISRKTGSALVSLANVQRHVSIAKTFMDDLKKLSPSPAANSSAEKIMETRAMLQFQVDSAELHATYLQERARTQQSVIFNLLGREDANASKAIAAAAKEDSSAMKTIALMTMAFLPATFFAALFAMPLLKWDEKSVIQPRFKIYWAFTLPSTALVFILWGAPTLWKKRRRETDKNAAQSANAHVHNGKKSSSILMYAKNLVNKPGLP